MSGTTYALLVGIDAYAAPVSPLRGCVNDVEGVAALLAARAQDPDSLAVRLLRNQEATREAVVAAFQEHLGQAGAADSALFYYAGHGAQAPAPPEMWHLEPDHLLETLVLHDSRQPGKWDLADKELAVLIAGVAVGGAHVLVVLDCCHSGSGTRRLPDDGAVDRLTLADNRLRPFATFLGSSGGLAAPAAPGVAPSVRGAAAVEQTAAPHVLLAACRPGQTAKEVGDAGVSHGAFSSGLQAALRESSGPLTYRDVHRWASAAVRNRVSEQSPQLEVVSAADLDLPFLGGVIAPTPPYVTLSREGKSWTIDAGAVHGIPESVGQESTELAVFARAAATGDEPDGRVGEALATGRVTEVLPDRSTVALSAELDPAASYRAVVTALPLLPMTVRLVGSDADLAPLRAAFAQVQATLVAQVTGEGEGEVVVRASLGRYVIGRPGAAGDRVTTVTGVDAAARAAATVQHIARWLRLARLRNPATALTPDAVRVQLTTPEGVIEGPEVTLTYAVSDGAAQQPAFTVTLTNTTDRRLWCALVDLTEPYGVFTDAFAAGSVELAPGETATAPLLGEVSDSLVAQGIRSLTDQLKVVVSTSEFDPRTLEQPELDVSVAPMVLRGDGGDAAARPAPTSTLERLMQRVATRRLGTKPAATERIADWTSSDVFVTVVRPEV